jgi:hypothetical protein
MNRKINFTDISLKDLASIVSKKFVDFGLNCTLVGGACVSIYSQNRYQSYDLDYVTCEDMKKVSNALKELGFEKKDKYFRNPDCKYIIEFVSPPVAIGNEPVHEFEYYKTNLGGNQNANSY